MVSVLSIPVNLGFQKACYYFLELKTDFFELFFSSGCNCGLFRLQGKQNDRDCALGQTTNPVDALA